jgi:ubiquitin thioesterase protein OTUB1
MSSADEDTQPPTDPPSVSNDGIDSLSHQDKVLKTQDQMNAIAQEIQASQALTSELIPLESLKSHYTDDGSMFLRGIEYLQTRYEKMRTTRGDGNCFYRAVWYQLCDTTVETHPGEAQRLLRFFRDESMTLATTKGGYDEVALELFYDAVMEFFQRIVEKGLSKEEMHRQLTEEGGVSEYCTWYLRALTATWVKAHADTFVHYLDEEYFGDVQRFCAAQIEPVGSEATNIPITALAECLGIAISIEYLDGHAFDPAKGLVNHVMGDDNGADSKMKLTLLYRPGHYDILYPKT